MSTLSTSTTKCAIMQPTYFPWMGYFHLIASVKTFVFLDDVQFARRSWQSRNRILVDGKPYWLTVPIKKTARASNLCEIEMQEGVWREKHLQTLKHHYSKAPYKKEMLALVETIFASPSNKLSQFNQHAICTLAEQLGLKTEFVTASQLQVGGVRSEHLYHLCKELESDTYLSAAGSKEYIEEEGIFAKNKMDVIYQNFIPPAYQQGGTDGFVSHLSILDAWAWVGGEQVKKLIEGAL